MRLMRGNGRLMQVHLVVIGAVGGSDGGSTRQRWFNRQSLSVPHEQAIKLREDVIVYNVPCPREPRVVQFVYRLFLSLSCSHAAGIRNKLWR
jgi:hypothetical protein